MKRFFFLTLIFFALSACRSVDHGVCPAPNSNIEWFLVVQPGPPWLGDNNWCVMCDNSVPEDELQAWALENASGDTSENALNNPSPCLYVYSTDEFDTDTVTGCRANICSDSPNSNDGVGKHHGVWKSIDPIWNGDLIAHEAVEMQFEGNEIMKPRSFDSLTDPSFYVAP